jgi:RNA recognition motif-containing protein
MNNKLFVGNLSFKTTQQELQDYFAEYGEVISVSIPQDRETGRQRGFAFVEMGDQAGAEAAIKGMNGRDVGGRQIAVSISQPKPKGGGGGGGGGRGRY